MRIDLTIDTRELERRAEISSKQFAYAAVNGIRRTALRIQEAEREHVRRVFVIRKTEFMMREAAVIWPNASVSQGRPYAEISAGSPRNPKKNLLLAGFEDGAERKPFTPGAKSVANPLSGRPARPSSQAGVPYAFSFAGLKLRAYYRSKKLRRQSPAGKNPGVGIIGEYGKTPIARGTAGVQWKGQQRTFLLPITKREPFGGVFQRIGPERGDIREIWAFHRGQHLDTRLQWVRIARAVADEWLARDVEAEILEAVEHNRLRLLQ